MASNKFATAFSAIREAEEGRSEPAEAAAQVAEEGAAPARTRTPRRRTPAPPPIIEHRGPGRPAGGKRSNPEFRATGVRIREETHLEATIRLKRTKEYADFSELVQALVDQWLKK